MKYSISWLKWFNKNKNKDLYDVVLKELFKNHKRCIYCNGPIYYYDSTYSYCYKTNLVSLKNKSYKSKKTIYNVEYNLIVCEDCLTKKHPEYKNINKSRVFNRMCEMTIYAFNIPEDLSKKWKKENYPKTKDNMIRKYGEIDGIKKWKIYCEKQALVNKYEYKKNKYNWSETDFNNYNKSRSITFENLVKKYGEIEGGKKWSNYIEKQKITKSKDYMIEKHGEEFWEKMNNSKRHNIENYRNRYGDDAELKLKEYFEKIKCYKPSKTSQIYFNKLDDVIKNKYNTQYFEKTGKEYGKLLSNGRYVFLDYYIKDYKICIEYNGDIYHANPNKYNADDIPLKYLKKPLKKFGIMMMKK